MTEALEMDLLVTIDPVMLTFLQLPSKLFPMPNKLLKICPKKECK